MSWADVRGIDRMAAYDRLGLVPTGQSGDRNDYATCGRAGPNGWMLVILGRVEHRLVKAHALQRLEREIPRLQDTESPADEFGVDHFFDIPLMLARGITSLKHDEAGLDEFEQLEWKSAAEPPSARSWRRFGRK